VGFLTSDGVEQLFVRNGVPSEKVFLTAFFCLFIFMTNFNAFNVRTHKINLLENVTENTGFLLVVLAIFAVQVTFTYIGGNVLRTVGLTPHEWGVIIAASSVIIPFDILRKALLRLLRLRSGGKSKSE
jgi:magnesium-transporting ATPase (P-type)